jgi:hypothetical protein
MSQEQINSNFRERLCMLEAQQQTMTAFLLAIIENHTDPQALKSRFSLASEHLLASAVQKPLPELWLESSADYRGLLERACDRRIAEINHHRS